MSDINNDQQLMDIFYKETQDLIDDMGKDLSALGGRQEVSGQIALPTGQIKEQSLILSRLFRQAHTIKSNSASVGFKDMSRIAGTLEKIFKTMDIRNCMMTADVISLLSESVKSCQKLLNQEEVVDCERLLERLNKILNY